MIDLYVDLETVPCQDPAYRAELRKGIKAPAQYKKPDSIAAWMAENAEDATDEALAKTSFDPAAGHICTIGFALGDEPAESFHATTVQGEKWVIEQFYDRLPKLGMVRVIGHYISGFDLRFLLCRSIILGVPIPPCIPRDTKPWSEFVFDTMTAWAGAKGTISQDRLAKALGLAGKGDFDGSMVAAAWAAGEHDKIAAYCRSDIETVRAIHKRFEAVNF